MADTANTKNPNPQGSNPVQDTNDNLDINLDEAPKTDSPKNTETKNTETDLDLNLDINLDEAPKTNNQTKKEEQQTPVVEKTANPFAPKADMPEIPTLKEETPVVEETPKINEIPVIEKETPNSIKENNLNVDIKEAPKTDDRLKEEDIKNQKEETPKINETETSNSVKESNASPKDTETDLNIDLDLNLKEAPKTDDRLKEEDIKNQKEETPKINETPITENPPKIEKTPVVEETPKVNETPVVENPKINENPFIEETPVIKTEASSTIKEINDSEKNTETEKTIKPNTLQEDMKIIENLQTEASSGGLNKEANQPPAPTTEETPKTFDLDAMLGTTPTINTPTPTESTKDLFTAKEETAQKVEQNQEQIPTKQVPETIAEKIPNPTVTVVPKANNESTNNTQKIQTPLQKKTHGVKTLLFVVLFVVLGFITYFILRTMYPVEFSNMFNNSPTETTNNLTGDTENKIENSEDSTGSGEEITKNSEDTTGNVEETTLETGTGDHESADNIDFGELNDIGVDTETIMETTDINRLTDYVNKGNELWETGKTMNNNTIIKFSLYIKTKATSFLDKIAKGEEINNLDSYFSQFDQYITQIEELIKETNQEQPEEDPLFPPMEETTRPTMPTTPTNNTTGNNTPSLQAMSE